MSILGLSPYAQLTIFVVMLCVMSIISRRQGDRTGGLVLLVCAIAGIYLQFAIKAFA